jgi:hypothetical protein
MHKYGLVLVIIKLWPQWTNGTAAMLAMIFTQGVANPACNIFGLPLYQLAIPNASIYFGSTNGVSAALAGAVNTNIDLYQIQQAVVETF